MIVGERLAINKCVHEGSMENEYFISVNEIIIITNYTWNNLKLLPWLIFQIGLLMHCS